VNLVQETEFSIAHGVNSAPSGVHATRDRLLAIATPLNLA